MAICLVTLMLPARLTLAHGPCLCGPAAQRPCPCGAASSGLECGLAVQMHLIVLRPFPLKMRASAMIQFRFLGGIFIKSRHPSPPQGALCGHKSAFIGIIGKSAKAQAHDNHASTRLAYLLTFFAIFASRRMPFKYRGSDVTATCGFF